MLLLRILCLAPALLVPASAPECSGEAGTRVPSEPTPPMTLARLDLRHHWMPEVPVPDAVWATALRLVWEDGVADAAGERRRWTGERAAAAELALEAELGRSDAFASWIAGEAHWTEAVHAAAAAAERTGVPGWPVAELPAATLRAVIRGWHLATDYAARLALLSPIAWPVRTSSGFGWRRHPILGRRLLHAGVDLAVPVGTEVLAANHGVVLAVGEARGSGRYVVIDHGAGIRTSYFHLDRIEVRRGQAVERGQVVGRSGETGRVTGPHLHFELRVRGEPVDPMPLLATPVAAPEETVLAGS